MTERLTCPSCQHQFELTAVLKSHLETTVRASYEARVHAANEKEAELLRRERALEAQRSSLALTMEERLAEERIKLRAELATEEQRRAQLEIEAAVRGKDEELALARAQVTLATKKEAEIMRRDRELQEREATLLVERERAVSAATAAARIKVEAEAEVRMKLRLEEAVGIKERALADAEVRLKSSADRELELVRRAQILEEKERLAKVERERSLALEAERIRAKAAEDYGQALALRDAESRQKQDSLQKKIDELSRNVNLAIPVIQGGAQEDVLEDLLRRSFPKDTIVPVPTGTAGGDLTQVVRDPKGSECGKILWESKRTTKWSNVWLPKLRDDRRDADATVAVLVTQAMPAGITDFGIVDEIWVCSWRCAAALAGALRAGIVDVALARRAIEGQNEKAQLTYAYLMGDSFKNRVSGLVEAVAEMCEDLNHERRAIAALWKKRERQIQRAMESMSGFYGDLTGIAGGQIPHVEGLELPAPVPALSSVKSEMIASLAAHQQPLRYEQPEPRYEQQPLIAAEEMGVRIRASARKSQRR